MTLNEFLIKAIDPQLVDEKILLDFFKLSDILRAERDPDEPIPPTELRLKYFRDKHPHYNTFQWLVFANKEGQYNVIGSARIRFITEEAPGYQSNKHITNIEVNIHPNYRRKGIGKKLLQVLVNKAREKSEITDVYASTTREEGHEFCKRFGGQFSQEGTENRLRIDDIDWQLIDEWIKEGEKIARKYHVSIDFFETCPEEIIDEYVNIYTETNNQQPLGEFDGEIKTTRDSRRLDEKKNKEKGMQWYTMITKEENGKISGLTEIMYHAQLEHKAFQNLTGVSKEYRGRGLGKLLKARMLKWFVNHHAKVKYIVTGNDTSNAPMLSINKRMGFKEFTSGTSYKFDLAKLEKEFN